MTLLSRQYGMCVTWNTLPPSSALSPSLPPSPPPGTRRVHANEVYQEYIKDKNHYHMNATRVSSCLLFLCPMFSRLGTLCLTLLLFVHLFHWMGGSWVLLCLLVCYTHIILSCTLYMYAAHLLFVLYHATQWTTLTGFVMFLGKTGTVCFFIIIYTCIATMYIVHVYMCTVTTYIIYTCIYTFVHVYVYRLSTLSFLTLGCVPQYPPLSLPLSPLSLSLPLSP